jgi:hypothetical protein
MGVLSVATVEAPRMLSELRAVSLTLSTILTLSCPFLLLHRAQYSFNAFPILRVSDIRGAFQQHNPRL